MPKLRFCIVTCETEIPYSTIFSWWTRCSEVTRKSVGGSSSVRQTLIYSTHADKRALAHNVAQVCGFNNSLQISKLSKNFQQWFGILGSEKSLRNSWKLFNFTGVACRSELGEVCIAGSVCGCPLGQKRSGINRISGISNFQLIIQEFYFGDSVRKQYKCKMIF